jgi:hypothetical protein
MPDSSTGGYLEPEATPAPLEDGALLGFLHGFLVGLTGLSADLVRRAWQKVPAPDPGPDVTWLAFSVLGSRPDSDPHFEQVAAPLEADPEADPPVEADPDRTFAKMRRHEELDVLVACYGPACGALAGVVRDGVFVEQNRTALRAAGVGLVGVSNPVHAPEPVNLQWFDRWDVTLTLRREIVRVYPVLHLVRAQGEISESPDGVAVSVPFDTEGVAP